jgi:hypothetical protein
MLNILLDGLGDREIRWVYTLVAVNSGLVACSELRTIARAKIFPTPGNTMFIVVALATTCWFGYRARTLLKKHYGTNANPRS